MNLLNEAYNYFFKPQDEYERILKIATQDPLSLEVFDFLQKDFGAKKPVLGDTLSLLDKIINVAEKKHIEKTRFFRLYKLRISIYINTQEYDQAFKACDAFFEAMPQLQKEYFETMARICKAMADYERAYSYCQKAFVYAPTAFTHFLSARIAIKLEKNEEALKQFDIIFKTPVNQDVYYQILYNAYVEFTVSLCWYSKASEFFQKYLEYNTSFVACINVLNVYLALNKFDEAQEIYKKTKLELTQPTNDNNFTQKNNLIDHKCRLVFYRGLMYEKQSNLYDENSDQYIACYKKAITKFRYALSLETHRSKVEIYAYMAHSFYRLKDYENALLAWNKSIELDSTAPRLYIYRAMTYGKLGGAYLELAAADMAKAFQISPHNPFFYYRQGILLFKRYQQCELNKLQEAVEHFDIAIKEYDKAVKKNEGNFFNHINRADTYKRLFKFFPQRVECRSEAIASYNKALALAPSLMGIIRQRDKLLASPSISVPEFKADSCDTAFKKEVK